MNENNVQKHTPGPWECDTYLPEGYRVHPVGDKNYQTKTPEEFFANAQLIASAPDLLSACEYGINEGADGDILRESSMELRRFHFRFGSDSGYDILADKLDKKADLIDAAIKKAKGE